MEFSESGINHKVSDYVVYRNNGICRISEISKADYGFGKRMYYLLRSVYDNNTKYYVPADGSDKQYHIRSVMTPSEINTVISDCENVENEWIDDSRERTERFTEILQGGNRAEILWLVKMLSLHKEATEQQKRKFYANDERILSSALQIITEEFAFALGIEKDEVMGYIMSRIGLGGTK